MRKSVKAEVQGRGVHSDILNQVHLYTLSGQGRVFIKLQGMSSYQKWYEEGVWALKQAPKLEAFNATWMTLLLDDSVTLSGQEFKKDIINRDTFQLKTPEHFLAALVFAYPSFQILNKDLYVRLESEEFPILDGSAWPWIIHLTQTLAITKDELIHNFLINNGHQNGTQFLIQYELTHLKNANSSGQVIWSLGSLSLLEKSQLIQELLCARSFIQAKDLEALKNKGLLVGANFESGWASIQQGPGLGVWTWNHYHRVPQGSIEREFLLHKCVDFIGDLAILSLRLPRGPYSLRNAGHFEHHQILKGLLDEYFR